MGELARKKSIARGPPVLRAALISLSESRTLRSLAEKSPLGQRVSGRFVAGTLIEDALRVAAQLNQAGLSASLDNLGENVSTAEEARRSGQLYSRLLSEIRARGLNANVSLKLTHMGIDIDPELARENVAALVRQAASIAPSNFVRVDMEGSAYTERTLDLVRQLHRLEGNENSVGAVIQSYLRRSQADVETLLGDRIRIRLCKGAY
ncbi:MAG: proline dehydrogenase family protein, partial [Acidobacteria bacterium]|nr:proline dehydrogenase family protein [Acidobacteriota bacterium]